MAKFKIVPVSNTVATVDTNDIDVIAVFAANMNSDMTQYFKAIPISDEEFETLSKEIETYKN